MITLDESHIYRVGGVVHPSVNKILDLFFPPSDFYTDDGRAKGTARHAWFHAIARGMVIANDPPEELAGAIIGFRKFMDEVKPEYVSGEVPHFDPLLRVCGTPDLVCKIADRLSVVDFKPETKNKRTPLQTAGYKAMLKNNNIPVWDRYELRISDGDYRLDKHINKDDERRWPILVAAYHAAGYYK